jgi:hypothetical protein
MGETPDRRFIPRAPFSSRTPYQPCQPIAGNRDAPAHGSSARLLAIRRRQRATSNLGAKRVARVPPE